MSDKIKDLIYDLGAKEPDEIADFLRGQGIKGDHFSMTCVVAKYLTTTAGLCADGLAVYIDTVSVWSVDWKEPILYKTPDNLSTFIVEFDSGVYSDLEGP